MKHELPKTGKLYTRKICVFFVLFVLGPRIAHSAGSPGIPLEYYQQNRLLPARRPSRGKPVEAAGPDVERVYETVAAGPGEYPIDLSTAAEVLNTRLVLENRGLVDVVDPWVTLNGKWDWFDLGTLMKEALAGETDPERRAFRIWRFARDNRYHWDPPEPDNEIHDPIKMFNIYGYGLCDDAAAAMESMFKAAGFQDSRVWGLSGHVVPEVFYNLRWHMFDADLEVFYPRLLSHDVASVDACMQDGWLVERVSGPLIREIYETIEDNEFYRNAGSTGHTMSMTLRPGEQLERFWEGWNAFHSYGMPHDPPPPRVGNGRLSYSVPLDEPAVARRGLSVMTNTEITTSRTDVTRLILANPAATGEVMLQMHSPYVFVGGRLQVVARLLGAGDTLSAEFTRDGVEWRALGSVTGPLEGPVELGLNQVILPWYSQACYGFTIRLKLKGTARGSVSLTQLLAEGEIQCSPMSLPALDAAKINKVSVRFKGEAGASLAVIHECRVMYASPTDPQARLNMPWIQFGLLKPAWFSWYLNTPLEDGAEAMISRDPDGVLPVAPPLWQWCGLESRWNPDTEFLIPNGKYYWGVRYKDTAGNWRRWSSPQAFTYQSNNKAADWRQYE